MSIRAPDICDADELVARAAAMRDTLRGRQAECEALGRLPDATNREYIDAGFFRVLQPRRFGGLELGCGPSCASRSSSRADCPSSGWVFALTAGHAHTVTMWPEQGQVELFGDGDFRCPLSNLPAKAVRVDGGYRIDGWWDYGSGCDTGDAFHRRRRRGGRARPHPLGGVPARGLRDRRQLGHPRHARDRLAAGGRRRPLRPRAPHGGLAESRPPGRRVPGPRRAREPDLPRWHDHAAARLRARGGCRRRSPRARSTTTSSCCRRAASTGPRRRCGAS